MSDEAKHSAASAAAPDDAIDPASARAKPLPLRLPLVPADEGSTKGLIPARMINEVLYCERLLYLEYVQGEWADNVFTADGNAVHRRVNEHEKALKTATKPKLGPTRRAPSGFLQSDSASRLRSTWSKSTVGA